ncbi:MAG: glycoside hydrolase family 30 beta sandwich domain-containing protein [Prolixibacteraceae bacterium]
MKISKPSFVIALILVLSSCNGTQQKKVSASAISDGREMWMTTADQSALFEKMTWENIRHSTNDSVLKITIDADEKFQTIDGFGYTLTGGSARLMQSMHKTEKEKLLNELFATDENNIGISYLRISVGASDLSDSVFTYNDLPVGEKDLDLNKFSIDVEKIYLIPLLKAIKIISPEVQLMGSPWSAPAWMKDNESLKGGSLKPEFYEVYANYLVKYLKMMKAEGLKIDALTVQNEPLHPGNNPSMFMSAEDQTRFVKNFLGPAFEREGISTKIIIYDHNADRTDYPISILNDENARKYIDGSAFHLYGGQVNDISKVHEAHPDKNLYFTEQWIGGPANFSGDLNWHIENLIVGATRNWCRTVLEWNLAADSNYEPHADKGGCTSCLGAITVNGDAVERNPAYYIIAHASKFVRPGSVRIASNLPANLPNVAFLTPDDRVVIVVLNKSPENTEFQMELGDAIYPSQLDAGAVATFVLPL